MKTNEELQKDIDSLNETVNQLKTDLTNLLGRFDGHEHNVTDGTKKIRTIEANRGDFVKVGDTCLVGSVSASGSSDSTTFGISTGPDSFGFNQRSLSTDFNIDHYQFTNGSENQSFIRSFRPPLYVNSGKSITAGASTLSDTGQSWTTNQLAGAYIYLFDSSGNSLESRQIASNTATQITIDGTWASTDSNVSYIVYMPVYLGAANIPWRQVYIGGDDVSSGGTGAQRRVLRFGYGTTSGADVIGIYYGTGSPESVVTANVGSLYLRKDGSTSTTLYVKTSGTGSTGWSAK